MLTALIMAGGTGERFWPLSSPEKPKQLLSLFSNQSMIRETVNRILPIIPEERIFIGTNVKQVAEIQRELPMIPIENILIEPAFKDTAAAIGYGAVYINHRFPNSDMVVLASDHLIKNESSFRDHILLATQTTGSKDVIVTLGIKPSHPETGYGYLEMDEEDEGEDQVRDVIRFWEKPNKERAEYYVEMGKYLWNSGMFIFKTKTILEEIERYMPRHFEILNRIEEKINQDIIGQELSGAVATDFDQFEKISIDFGVMERSTRIKVIPSDFGWNDIGSYNALREVFPPDYNDNILKDVYFSGLDCYNNIVLSDHYEVKAIGVHNLVIVQHDNQLLICHKDRVQEIKKLL